MIAETIATIFNHGYIAQVAGALTVNFLDGLDSKQKRWLEEKAAGQALSRCVATGVTAVIRAAGAQAPESADLLAEILNRFFKASQAGERPEVRLSDVFTTLYLKDVTRREGQSVPDAILKPDRNETMREQKKKAERLPIQAVEAIGALDRLVVLGRPGGGKSTLVNHIAARLARHHLKNDPASPLPGWRPEACRLPVRIILRRFAAWMPEGDGPGAARLIWD